ncbi:uncharacterized protein LOC106013384, partial [Aplysia californica]|uniref:Uncharacterized protein LOC106013384 n=1 Tax=Aplysia californica TaxID=6500 RepID=A0ABM1ABA6_APLCA
MNSTLKLNNITQTLNVAIKTTLFDKYTEYPDAYDIERVWYYLVGVAGTVVGAMGVVFNGLSLGVWTSSEMRTNSGLYMIMLAVYDMTFLLLNTTFVSAEYFYFGLTGSSKWFNVYVRPSMPVVDSVMNVALTCSVYTTIA